MRAWDRATLMNSLPNPCTQIDGRRSGGWTNDRTDHGRMDGLAKKRYPKMQHGDDDPPSFSPPLPPLSLLEWMIDLFAHLIYVLLRRTKSSEPPPAPLLAASACPSAASASNRSSCERERRSLDPSSEVRSPFPLRKMREGGTASVSQ